MPHSPEVYYRVVALWAVCEGMLGGLIHGLRLPVSGLVVGSAAVICISLIAWYYPVRGAIIRATILVAVFKFMISPQASLPAYIAVLFQGAVGEMIFRGRKHFSFSCIALAILALLESALQRILVMTIIYGNEFWNVLNEFAGRLTGRTRAPQFSLWLGIGYVSVHLLAGIVTGIFSSRLPTLVARQPYRSWSSNTGAKNSTNLSRPRKRRLILLIAWAILLAMLLQSGLDPDNAWLPSGQILMILVRSLLVILSWVLIVGPVLKFFLKKWLNRKRSVFAGEIRAITETMPSIQNTLVSAWKNTSRSKKHLRLHDFAVAALSDILRGTPRFYFLTGPVNTGKTRFLEQWLKGKEAGGILTPKREGKRVFLDIAKGVEFQMEADEQSGQALTVGKYRFHKANFESAIEIIRGGVNQNEWLIIDEAGPLELRGEGFASVIQEALQEHRGKILLVVREGLLEEIKKKFRIGNAETVFYQTHPSLIIEPGLN